MSTESREMHTFAWDPSTDFDLWRSSLMEAGWMLDDQTPHREAEDGFIIYSFVHQDA